MSLPVLFLSAFVIGLSGAMMPGPLLTYVINGSLRRGFIAGPLLVLGHGLLEFLLILMIILGLDKLFANPLFTAVMGIIGGLVLLWMGYGMIKSAVSNKISLQISNENNSSIKGLVLPGALVSMSNPYWILWWATVGITYLANASKQGLIGGSLFFLGHISSDLIWYSLISWIVVFGKKIINDSFYRGLIIFFGIVLMYFACSFIYSGTEYFL